MGKLTTAVKNLIIINVFFFVASQYVMPQMYEWFSLFFPKNEHFGVWQIVTHMFMHGGFMHILFNMYALWAFGSPLEQMWGTNKFFFFYFSAGIGAALIYTGVNYLQFNTVYNDLINGGLTDGNIQQILTTGKYDDSILAYVSQKNLTDLFQIYHTPAVGASGAIYGVLVAFGMTFPNAKLALIFFPVPISAKYFIPGLIAIDLFLGLGGSSLFGSTGVGIAHFAHVGGAIIGYIMMKYWQKNQFNNNRWN